ncbi:MAG: sigma-70 family RNA polymerase sigma factor [Proteobacteria bacterium]|nr:sigma-70 family RNA polymerase sigma factor [Pseudomonadota bacterium]
MSDRAMRDVTALLGQISQGDQQAANDLLPLVYEELRRLARGKMARERPGQTLQATALVHEAYLRLVASDDPGWDGRAHFYASAAEAMRRILIDRARRVVRDKHGGGYQRVSLSVDDIEEEKAADELIALDDALQTLSERDPQMARVVTYRYYGGLSVAETAKVMDISTRSVDRYWSAARVWLASVLKGEG